MFQELLLDRNLLSAVPSSSLNGPKVLKAITLSHNRIGATNLSLIYLSTQSPQQKARTYFRLQKDITKVTVARSLLYMYSR
jgi:hypothetical protein